MTKQPPRNNGVRIGRSKISGRGLFATRDFDKTEVVCRYTGRIYKDSNCPSNRYLVGLGKDETLDGSSMSNIGRWANHSCKPNAKIATNIEERKVWLVAKRRIRPGEEVTVNYGKGYRKRWMQDCRCLHCKPVKDEADHTRRKHA